MGRGSDPTAPSRDAAATSRHGPADRILQQFPVDLNQDGFRRPGRDFAALIRLQESDDAEGLFGGFAGTGDRDGAGWRFAA